MNMRGRPRKNGQQPMWILRRETLVLYGYDEARRVGEKHDAAVKEAVTYVKSIDPLMKISETEVRRVLAFWRPRNHAIGLVVGKSSPMDNPITLPGGRLVRTTYTAGFGPRPTYPRVNAARKPSEHNKN
jgi:hypothetical protein